MHRNSARVISIPGRMPESGQYPYVCYSRQQSRQRVRGAWAPGSQSLVDIRQSRGGAQVVCTHPTTFRGPGERREGEYFPMPSAACLLYNNSRKQLQLPSCSTESPPWSPALLAAEPESPAPKPRTLRTGVWSSSCPTNGLSHRTQPGPAETRGTNQPPTSSPHPFALISDDSASPVHAVSGTEPCCSQLTRVSHLCSYLSY